MQLNQEIEKVKEAHMAGFSRGGQTEQNVQLNLGALAALDAADLSANGECIKYDMCALILIGGRSGEDGRGSIHSCILYLIFSDNHCSRPRKWWKFMDTRNKWDGHHRLTAATATNNP